MSALLQELVHTGMNKHQLEFARPANLGLQKYSAPKSRELNVETAYGRTILHLVAQLLKSPVLVHWLGLKSHLPRMPFLRTYVSWNLSQPITWVAIPRKIPIRSRGRLRCFGTRLEPHGQRVRGAH
jgi:hypothetical protein